MATSDKSEQGRVALKVAVRLESVPSGDQTPALHAYAFSKGGRLLDRAAVEKGGARLNVPRPAERTEIRVMVGPVIDGDDILAELVRRGGVERHLRYSRDDKELGAEFQILEHDWRRWLGRFCCVPGKVVKTLYPGGIGVDYPVCHAVVEVFEVDPIWIILPRVPDYELDWLRQLLDRERPFPPIPDPPQPDPPYEILKNRDLSVRAFRESAPPELAFRAQTLSNQAFRDALVEHWEFIRPFFCWWWPRYVTMQKLGQVETDECGHFRFCFFNSVFNPDIPDLYFRVYRPFFGFEIELYAPKPVACHTWWDYDCGTEVILRTNHPLALTCSPCPPVIAGDNWVLVMAVGNLSLRSIHGTSKSLAGTTTGTNRGLTSGGAPFGGRLGFRLEFDPSLRDSLGVRYYRMQYRRAGALAWHDLVDECFRYYAHMVSGVLVQDPFRLGPQPPIGGVTNLFEIPPAAPPAGVWVFPDVTVHHANGFLPSDMFVPPGASGLYEVKLDLFDAAGNPVNIGAKGIRYFVPSVELFTGTITTDNAADPQLNLVAGDSFVMPLHIDTNLCTSTISAPQLGGVLAGDDCGVMEYDPANPGTVTMNFTAHHPNGFATYGFQLYRGINFLAPPSTSGAVGSGTFSVSASVTSLLGGCLTAGFSESVFCFAMATDGWSRQSQYDPSPNPKSFGFVLTPQP